MILARDPLHENYPDVTNKLQASERTVWRNVSRRERHIDPRPRIRLGAGPSSTPDVLILRCHHFVKDKNRLNEGQR